MTSITIATPRLQVGWRCRRCQFEGWIAPTWPLPTQGKVWENEEAGRELRAAIRQALVGIHLRKHRCFAVHDDFELFPYVRRGDQVLGQV